MKKWIGIAVVVIIVIACIWYYIASSGTPVRVAKVVEGKVSAFVEERAMTTLPHVYHITMPLSGRIEPITLREGTPVKKDQTVANMDIGELNTRVAETRARADTILKQIDLNKFNAIEDTAKVEAKKWVKTMADAVNAALKKSEASKARLAFAEWYLKSCQEMLQAISIKERNHAQMVAAEAKVDYEADLFMYSATRTVCAIFDMADTYIDEYLNRKKLQGNVLQQELKAALANWQQALRNKVKADIQSPTNGIILKRYVMNERMLPAGAKLLDIGNLENLEVTANILSQQVVRIRPGNPVDIYGAAIGEIPIRGVVDRIKPEGFTKVSSLGVEEQRVPVVVKINPGDMAKLKKQGRDISLGYRVQVRIYTDSAPKAVTIPRTALFRGSGNSWQVFAIAGGSAKLVNLKIGISNYKQVQVEQGLKPGELVIVAPPVDLVTGTKVKYNPPEGKAVKD